MQKITKQKFAKANALLFAFDKSFVKSKKINTPVHSKKINQKFCLKVVFKGEITFAKKRLKKGK